MVWVGLSKSETLRDWANGPAFNKLTAAASALRASNELPRVSVLKERYHKREIRDKTLRLLQCSK